MKQFQVFIFPILGFIYPVYANKFKIFNNFVITKSYIKKNNI